MADISESRFLLASLHIKTILRGTTIARRKKALESIKDGAGLGDVYGVTLERIRAQDEEKTKLAIATLTWNCHSERPLQVDELCHALAVDIGATDFDPENIPSIGSLLHCCQGWITVDKEASTVRLIHHTVQEYLCSHPDLFSEPHSILAETCLTYLNSKQIKNLTPHSPPDQQSIPFLKYSSRYWGTHARRGLSDPVRTLALGLLGQYEDHVAATSLLKQVIPLGTIGAASNSPLFSGLHCASFFGIVELMATIINAGGCGIDQPDSTGSTPLSWVARTGHAEATKLLLEREDVDPNRLDKYDRTPLWWAALRGHEGVAKLLLERTDVDPNRPDMDNETPLLHAATLEHERVVKLLLEREDVDPNRPDKGGRTPLVYAAYRGHEGVVKLLLGRKDVNPNLPDEKGVTPLGYAAFGGHEGVVKLLLGREDVDPNRPDKRGGTPLAYAASGGYERVVKLLLGREDVDPNRPDKNGVTPLQLAAFQGHGGVAKLLLDQEGIDHNKSDEHGDTLLSYSTRRGHAGVVKLLQAPRSRRSADAQLHHLL